MTAKEAASAAFPFEGKTLVSVPEVADWINLSRRTVYDCLKDGKPVYGAPLHCVRQGRAVRVPVKALREWASDPAVGLL